MKNQQKKPKTACYCLYCENGDEEHCIRKVYQEGFTAGQKSEWLKQKAQIDKNMKATIKLCEMAKESGKKEAIEEVKKIIINKKIPYANERNDVINEIYEKLQEINVEEKA